MYQYKAPKKLKKEYLKYVLIEKETDKAVIYRFKTQLADFLTLNPRTISRNIESKGYYANKNYLIYPIIDVKY